MKNYIAENIAYLVKENNLRQDEFGVLFDLKKGVTNQYIQGKSLPKIETLQKISNHYNILIDEIVNKDLSLLSKSYKTNNTVAIASDPLEGNDYSSIIHAQRETIEAQKETIQALKTEVTILRSQLGHAS